MKNLTMTRNVRKERSYSCDIYLCSNCEKEVNLEFDGVSLDSSGDLIDELNPKDMVYCVCEECDCCLNQYRIQDKNEEFIVENGFYSQFEAQKHLIKLEKEDRKLGVYTKDFYRIVKY